MTISLRDAFDARMSDFDTYLVWNTEQDCVLRALENTGEIVELAFDKRRAAIAMAALRAVVSESQCSLDALRAGDGLELDWRSVQFATEDVFHWPFFFEEIRALLGFAALGIFTPWDRAGRTDLSPSQIMLLEQGKDVGQWVRDLTGRIAQLLQLAPVPAGRQYYPYGDLEMVATKALARLTYDEGTPLSPQELAVLSGVSQKRIQNAAYEKTETSPVFDKNGAITPVSAREWLQRKGFRFSIWPAIAALAPLGDDWGRDVEVDPEAVVNDDLVAEPEAEADYVFIPVAGDQSRFWPEVRRADGYHIGRKGEERTEPDYFKALEMLSRQSRPYWRRPNSAGNWGIVSGQGWERVLRSSLKAQLQSLAD
ncbi:hypothetical protein [Brevundimonas sp. DC300-4]|uniref:hypothetical protein n=1 Tax=Brevundimonas sp. DC300-4 TaxID=2804594 RepID=UPI003CFAB2F2